MVSVVPVVVMGSVTCNAAIRDSHLQRAFQPEGYDGVPGDPDRPTTRLAAVDRSNDRSHETLIALGFDAVWIGTQGITLPIHNDRFHVEY
jgi:hypothetical protein